MSPLQNSKMPLTKDELIKLKHRIDPSDYVVVEHGIERILVIRSPQEFPDIVNDLENMMNKFDLRDVHGLSTACIIGDAEVIGLSIEAIDSLVTRRIADDEVTATHLEEKLTEPFTTIFFANDNDPLNILRLGIRVPGKMEDFKPNQLLEVIFTNIQNLPRKSEVVYLIVDDGYVRLNGKDFYQRLSEYVQENPEVNKELSENIEDKARDSLADHFVGDEPGSDVQKTGKQEQLNNYLSASMEDNTTENSKTVGQDQTHTSAEGKPEPESKSTASGYQKMKGPLDGYVKKEAGSFSDPEPSRAPAPDKSLPTQEHFVSDLEEKLSTIGYEIISNVTVPGVDVVARDQKRYIEKIFFTYMPVFELKRALALENAIRQFSPDLSILIGPRWDADLKLFIIGKNITFADVITSLDPEYLLQIGENV